MRKSIMLIVWLYLFLTQLYSYQIIVGDGSDIDQHIPCDPFYNHSGSQLIYNSEYFPFCGTISQITFQYHFLTANPQNYLSNVTVMIGESPLSSFQDAESFINLAELAVCYTGDLTADNFQSSDNNGRGWLSITLDEAYNYSQTGNLVIFFLENNPDNGINADNFISFSTSQDVSMCFIDLVNPIDLDNLVDPLFIRNCLPNTIFEFTINENYPHPVSPLDNSNNVSETTSLKFKSLDPVNTEITIYTAFEEFNIPIPPDLTAQADDVYEFYPDLPFASDTYYEWQVKYSNEGTIYYSEMFNFTTDDQVEEITLTNPGTASNAVNLLWNSLYYNQYPYYIYRNGELIATQNENTLIDTQVSVGETYDYQVKFFYLDNSFVTSDVCTVELVNITSDIINEGFENYSSFQTDLGSWQNIDNDESTTYYLPACEYPNQGVASAFVVLEPAAIVPPLNLSISGEKCLVSFSSSTPPTSDILISPPFQNHQVEVDIYLKSFETAWGMERVKCGLIYNNDTENIHYFESGDYLEIPAEMTHLNFSHETESTDDVITNFWLESCGVQTLMLIIDRIVISSTETSNDDSEVENVSSTIIFPNPVTKRSFSLLNQKGIADVRIYNLKGQLVHKASTDNQRNTITLPKGISCGIYLVKVKSAQGETVKKISVLK